METVGCFLLLVKTIFDISLFQELKGEASVGSIDCQKYNSFCTRHGIQSFPTIRLYPHSSEGIRRSM